jgi:GGDEF domain-containing protein
MKMRSTSTKSLPSNASGERNGKGTVRTHCCCACRCLHDEGLSASDGQLLLLAIRASLLGTSGSRLARTQVRTSRSKVVPAPIANQVAISLQNGRMLEALEEKATTDGLTGLTNHRTFQERFPAMLGRAERHQMHVSFLLTDIDHFKKINDTHGHPTGDQVLRRVAAILKETSPVFSLPHLVQICPITPIASTNPHARLAIPTRMEGPRRSSRPLWHPL